MLRAIADVPGYLDAARIAGYMRGMSVRVTVCGGSPSGLVRRTSAPEPVTRDAVILDGLE